MSGAESGGVSEAEGQPFRLVPFDAGPADGAANGAGDRALGVEGRIARRDGRLWVEYRLGGARQALRIPEPAAAPRRRDGLWQATCVELFLAVPGQEGYREFNLSPSGDWNVYRLDGYRRGLRPDPAWGSLPLRRRERDGALILRMETLLPADLADAPTLEAAVTAVLAPLEGPCGFWALAHPGEEADFHRRDGFLLRL